MSGEMSSDAITSKAFAQLTPELSGRPCKRAFDRPIPRIAPINVCELEAGSARYHVPRFQRMAALKRARTIAMPVPEPIDTRSSTGRR
jgi:hypothetical protein